MMPMPTPSIRLSDLARELSIPDKELVEKGRSVGLLLSTMSRLDGAQADQLRALYAPVPESVEDVARRKPVERIRGGRPKPPEAEPEAPAEPDAPRSEGEILAYAKPEAKSSAGSPKPGQPKSRVQVVEVAKK